MNLRYLLDLRGIKRVAVWLPLMISFNFPAQAQDSSGASVTENSGTGADLLLVFTSLYRGISDGTISDLSSQDRSLVENAMSDSSYRIDAYNALESACTHYDSLPPAEVDSGKLADYLA